MTERATHPAVASLLEFFTWAHLPPHLQEISRPVGELAHAMAEELPSNAELTVGLRKLLEAKDCFVRAKLSKAKADDRPPPTPTPSAGRNRD